MEDSQDDFVDPGPLGGSAYWSAWQCFAFTALLGEAQRIQNTRTWPGGELARHEALHEVQHAFNEQWQAVTCQGYIH